MEITINNVTKNVRFTKPQQAIMERLIKGDRATFINTHWMSGGEFVWYCEDGDYSAKEFVGYKAFNGAMWAIRKAFNLTSEQENALYEEYIINPITTTKL